MSLSYEDKTLRIWDIETETEIRSFTDPKVSIEKAVLSPSGKTIIAYLSEGDWGRIPPSIKLWDLTTGNERGSFDCQLKGIRDIAFSPDGQIAAVGGEGDGQSSSPPKLLLLSTGLKE